MSGWPDVRLHDLLDSVQRLERTGPTRSYPLLGVRLNAKGAFLRETLPGSSVSASSLNRVAAGDFVYSRLFAWRGAFAQIPAALDGSYVSGEFPLFLIDEEKLRTDFLLRWLELPSTLGSIAAASSGSTAVTRNRLAPARLLDLRIPLPPLDVQDAIVQTVRLVSEGAQAVLGHMEVSLAQSQRLIAAVEYAIWPDEALIGAPTLQDVTQFLSRGRQSQQGPSSHRLIKTQHVQMGAYVRTKMTLASEAAAKVQPTAFAVSGDTLIACSAAGCLGRVAYFISDGEVASTDTHVAIARPDPLKVLPEYLYRYLFGMQGQRQLRRRERGDWERDKIGFRLTELNLGDLQQVPVPVPSLREQRITLDRLARLDDLVTKIKRARASEMHKLESLGPSTLRHAFGGLHS